MPVFAVSADGSCHQGLNVPSCFRGGYLRQGGVLLWGYLFIPGLFVTWGIVLPVGTLRKDPVADHFIYLGFAGYLLLIRQ